MKGIHMQHQEEHEGHGNSVAAWVSVAVMLVASAIACLGVAKASTPMAVVGAAGFLIGAMLWPLLSRMGYGDKNPPRSLYSD
jgi:hypothetical protein